MDRAAGTSKAEETLTFLLFVGGHVPDSHRPASQSRLNKDSRRSAAGPVKRSRYLPRPFSLSV